MAQFISNGMNNIKASMVFENSFGKAGIMEDQTYYPGMLKTREQCEKAIQNLGRTYFQNISKAPSMDTTTGAQYTSYGLLPPFLDPEIVDRTVRMTPLVSLLPRKAARSLVYVYNILTAKGGAKFLGEDAALDTQVDTYSLGSATLKYLYAVGRATGPARASTPGFVDLLAEDIRVKTVSMNEALENEIINGNTTTNPYGFQGLIQSITTNAASNGGARLTLERFRLDVNTSFEANGSINLAITDGATHAYLKGLLTDYQRIVDSNPSIGMTFGIPDSFMIDGVMIIKDRYMPITAGSRRIIYLDTRYVHLAVLQDITYGELAQNNDSDKFFLKWYGTLVITFEGVQVQRTSLP